MELARAPDRYGRRNDAEKSTETCFCIRSIAIDEQGNKWIGTNRGGLAVYHEG